MITCFICDYHAQTSLAMASKLLRIFVDVIILNVPRGENGEANDLSQHDFRYKEIHPQLIKYEYIWKDVYKW